jgi:hypothetical protein
MSEQTYIFDIGGDRWISKSVSGKTIFKREELREELVKINETWCKDRPFDVDLLLKMSDESTEVWIDFTLSEDDDDIISIIKYQKQWYDKQ